MIVFKVELNGEVIAIAGKENLSVLTTIIGGTGNLGTGSAEDQDLRLNVGGLEKDEGEISGNHLRWCKSKTINVGDTISVNIQEADSADVAVVEKASDSEEEIKKDINQRLDWGRARAFYLKHKEKYENHD